MSGGSGEGPHVVFPSALRELLTPGRPVLLEPAARAARRTRFTVEAGLRTGTVPGCRGYRFLRREPAMGRNRADFLLARGHRGCLVEVKSVTLVRAGVGVRAFTCRVTPHGVWLTQSIPVRIPSGRRAVSEAYPVPERD